MARRRDKQQAAMQAGARNIFIVVGALVAIVVGVVIWRSTSSASKPKNVVRRQSQACLKAAVQKKWARMYKQEAAATRQKVPERTYVEWMAEIYKADQGWAVMRPEIKSVQVAGETATVRFRYDQFNREKDMTRQVTGKFVWKKEDEDWKLQPSDALKKKIEELEDEAEE